MSENYQRPPQEQDLQSRHLQLTSQDIPHSLRQESKEALAPTEEICAWYGTLRYLQDIGYHGGAEESVREAMEMEAVANATFLGASQRVDTRYRKRTELLLEKTRHSDEFNVKQRREHALAKKLLSDAHLRVFDSMPSTEGLSWFGEAGEDYVKTQILLIQLREYKNSRLFENYLPELQRQIHELNGRATVFKLQFEPAWKVASAADLAGIKSAAPLVDTLVESLLEQRNSQDFSNTILDEDVLGTLLTIGENAARSLDRRRAESIVIHVDKIIDKCNNLGGLGGMSVLVAPHTYTRLADLYDFLGKQQIATQKRTLAEATFKSGLSEDPYWLPQQRAVDLLNFIHLLEYIEYDPFPPNLVDQLPPSTDIATIANKVPAVRAAVRVVENFDRFNDPRGYGERFTVPDASTREAKLRVYARAGVLLLKLATSLTGQEHTQTANIAFDMLTQAAQAGIREGNISADQLANPFFHEFLIPLIDIVKSSSDYSWKNVFEVLQFDKLPPYMQDMIQAAYQARAYGQVAQDKAHALLVKAAENMGNEMKDLMDIQGGYGPASNFSPNIVLLGKISEEVIRSSRHS